MSVRIVRFLLVMAMLIFLGLASTTSLPLGTGWKTIFTIIGCCAALVYYFWRSRNLEGVHSDPMPVAEPVSLEEVVMAEEYVIDRYGADAIESLSSLLSSLPAYLSRVSEVIEFDGQSILSTTTQTFRQCRRGPEQAESGKVSDTLLVPLISARKGHLLQLPIARDAEGNELSTLSQWETRGLVAAVARSLLQKALIEVNRTPTVDDRIDLFRILQTTVFKMGRKDAEGTAETRRSLLKLERLDNSRYDESWLKNISMLCESLVRNYLIIVELPRPRTESTSIIYSTRLRSSTRLASLSERLRARHGLTPRIIDVPMTRVLDADSYHFQLLAPASCYVHHHSVEEIETERELVQADFTRNGYQQYTRFYRDQGQFIAHFYVRRQRPANAAANEPEGATLSDVKSIVKFQEIPPGSLGLATTIALVTAVILTYFTIFRVGLDPSLDTRANIGTQDIPALILIVPAFLAIVLGRSMNHESLGRSALTAFYSLWLSMTLAVTGVLLYLYGVSRGNPWDIRFSLLWISERQYSVAWIAVSLVAIGNFLFLRSEKVSCRRQYLSRRAWKAEL